MILGFYIVFSFRHSCCAFESIFIILPVRLRLNKVSHETPVDYSIIAGGSAGSSTGLGGPVCAGRAEGEG